MADLLRLVEKCAAEVLPAVVYGLSHVRNTLNDRLASLEPWQVLFFAIGFVLMATAIYSWLFDSILSPYARLKAFVFSTVRYVPVLWPKIEEKLNRTVDDVKASVAPYVQGQKYITKLPDDGMTPDGVLKEIERMEKLSKIDWKGGRVSGAVYHGGDELTRLITSAFEHCAWSNPLHPDVFPHVRKMEAEIVAMCLELFHGGTRGCGAVASGGTESILLACLSYRESGYARGIKYPEIVAPVSVHAAFEKAAFYFRMKLIHVPVDEKTRKCNVRAMAKAITSNTVLLVGSAPHFPHGAIDPIEEIAELALRHNIGCHVDCCLGGFLLPFMDAAGYPLAPFDFRAPGVTSISADTHKYGFAPKGTSVVMYSSSSQLHKQFFVSADWQGGIYATPTLAGSRAGAVIAGCWASMMHMGRNGYIDATRRIVGAAKAIGKQLRNVDGIFLFGEVEVSVVALGSKVFDIYRLGTALTERGWNLNALQFPSSIHLCCTFPHSQDGVVERFVADVKESVAKIMETPQAKSTGTAAIYGMAQSIPDRSLVNEIAYGFLDGCLLAKPKKRVRIDENGKT
eukprot:m.309021 g.309021  ORF g.309021 m.309021 type:complete len:569 (+) comp45291_c0_seq1:36-1742(+)